jgi:hypothetical protein
MKTGTDSSGASFRWWQMFGGSGASRAGTFSSNILQMSLRLLCAFNKAPCWRVGIRLVPSLVSDLPSLVWFCSFTFVYQDGDAEASPRRRRQGQEAESPTHNDDVPEGPMVMVCHKSSGAVVRACVVTVFRAMAFARTRSG